MATGAAERQASHTIGFESLEEEVHVDSLPVQGEVPGWLTGDLTRVTPALLDVGGVPLRHWFDGLAMLNAFRIGEGQRRLREPLPAVRRVREGAHRAASRPGASARTRAARCSAA